MICSTVVGLYFYSQQSTFQTNKEINTLLQQNACVNPTSPVAAADKEEKDSGRTDEREVHQQTM